MEEWVTGWRWIKDAHFQLRGSLHFPYFLLGRLLALFYLPVWGVGFREAWTFCIHLPLFTWACDVRTSGASLFISLASRSLTVSYVFTPPSPLALLPCQVSHTAGDLFEQSERLPVIWRWLGFSPRLFMGLEAAYLVISSDPFFSPGEECSTLYLAFLRVPSGDHPARHVGVFGKFSGAHWQPWGHCCSRKQPVAPSREVPRFPSWALGWGGGVRSPTLVTEFSDCGAWGARENPRFVHRLHLDSLSHLLSSLTVFPEFLGKIMMSHLCEVIYGLQSTFTLRQGSYHHPHFADRKLRESDLLKDD